MARVWKECLSPKYLHDEFGVYNGAWMPQMDRCWFSDDGYQVTSRILITTWGKVEHAAITYKGYSETEFSMDGKLDIPWAVKQEIKNEVFGENRLAIEVFPTESNKVDVMDVYHLWVFPKGYALPFGIHPTKDKKCNVVNRGCPKDVSRLVENSEEIRRLEEANKDARRTKM